MRRLLALVMMIGTMGCAAASRGASLAQEREIRFEDASAPRFNRPYLLVAEAVGRGTVDVVFSFANPCAKPITGTQAVRGDTIALRIRWPEATICPDQLGLEERRVRIGGLAPGEYVVAVYSMKESRLPTIGPVRVRVP